MHCSQRHKAPAAWLVEKAPRRGNAEGFEIHVKVISPKLRADIRVDDVHHVHIVRERDPSDHRQPKQG
jgi:hypothetical protein